MSAKTLIAVAAALSIGAAATPAQARSVRCEQAYDRYDTAINALGIAVVRACPRGCNRAPKTPAIVRAEAAVNSALREYRRACNIR